MKTIDKLTQQDWVTLRLLFYVLSTDTSSQSVKEIAWSMDFVKHLFGTDTVLKAFDMIRKDQVAIGAYDNPDSWAMKRLRQSIDIKEKNT